MPSGNPASRLRSGANFDRISGSCDAQQSLQIRARDRRPLAPLCLDDVPPLEVVDQPVERVETIDALWRAIDALNVDLKMALLLRDVVGLSYNEIAETLEVTLATVKWRIFKAREDVQLALVREGITEGALAADAKAS